MIPWKPEDFPEARFLGVFMRPVLMGFAPRACLERGRRCEMLDTATLLKAYPLATRRLLANRGNNTLRLAWLDIASELELRGELGPFVEELAKQLDETEPG